MRSFWVSVLNTREGSWTYVLKVSEGAVAAPERDKLLILLRWVLVLNCGLWLWDQGLDDRERAASFHICY
jgi:hypothetical protein